MVNNEDGEEDVSGRSFRRWLIGCEKREEIRIIWGFLDLVISWLVEPFTETGVQEEEPYDEKGR